MHVSPLFVSINVHKLSSYIDQISEHIHYPNHSYDQMSKMIVNLGIKKVKNNDNSSFQLTHLQNALLVSIYDSLEEYLSNVDGKSDMRKLRTSLVKSSSALFSCSKRAMYNRVNRAQK